MSMDMEFLRSARCSRYEEYRKNVVREKMDIENL